MVRVHGTTFAIEGGGRDCQVIVTGIGVWLWAGEGASPPTPGAATAMCGLTRTVWGD